MSLAPPGKC